MPIPFKLQFPLSSALGVKPVANAQAMGFDSDDLAAKLGTTRNNALNAWILANDKAVFCCGHRSWPKDHATASKRGAEVHCIFAEDLEAFLKAGN